MQSKEAKSYSTSLTITLLSHQIRHKWFKLLLVWNSRGVSFIELSKKLGVKQTICVCPIEFDHYSELRINPFEIRQDAENKAL